MSPAEGLCSGLRDRFASHVDHTLLRADATRRDIEGLCDEAVRHEFAAVCVNGAWVSQCAERLRDHDVRVVTVIGFPLGATTIAAKAREAADLVAAGADELDMVAAIDRIRDSRWSYVEEDIRAVVDAAPGRVVKVILETAALEERQIVEGARVAKRAGAGFVKTSTGTHRAGGATAKAVALLRQAVGDDLGVKAAGGIRDCQSALQMLRAGATRIGTSSATALARCLDQSTVPLAELVARPDGHEAVCRTRRSNGFRIEE